MKVLQFQWKYPIDRKKCLVTVVCKLSFVVHRPKACSHPFMDAICTLFY